MSASRRSGVVLLLAGVALLVAVRAVAPQGAPPLYDSFTAPDPYRYLHPAPGQRDSPATATATQPVTAQGVSSFVVATSENPPQAQLIVAEAGLAVPAGARTVTATIAPVDNPRPAPPNGVVAGNTYRFRIVADTGAPATVLPGKPATVVLRGPTGIGVGTLDEFDGGAWHPLATTPIAGPDIFAANVTRLGDVALVVAALPQPPGSRFGWVPWAAGGGAAAIAVGVVTWLLLGRRREARR